jgi:hypothetical protein
VEEEEEETHRLGEEEVKEVKEEVKEIIRFCTTGRR